MVFGKIDLFDTVYPTAYVFQLLSIMWYQDIVIIND